MNDDPIKENNPFRIGIDNLTGDDNINSGIEYNDLHNCSNDLSDRGSRREEIAHAKFAEQQRRNQYKNTYYANGQKNKKVVIAKNPGTVVVGIFVAYIAFQVIGVVVAAIIGMGEMFGEVKNTDFSYTPSYNYEYVDKIYDDEESLVPTFEVEMDTMKENIHIEVGKADNGNLMIRIENQSPENMYSTQAQMIFFDAESKPIAVIDLQIYTLYSKEVRTIEINNVPAYTSYDFLITERYADDTPYASEYYE